ncbi:MAG: hypothetical protein CL941_07820 [Desulfobacter sp.]|nr:hypothetical protein [Desulfobacter sp.]
MTEIFLGFYLGIFWKIEIILINIYFFIITVKSTCSLNCLCSKNQTNKRTGRRSLVCGDKRSVGISSNKAADSDAYTRMLIKLFYSMNFNVVKEIFFIIKEEAGSLFYCLVHLDK